MLLELEDRDRIINLAEAYQADQLPRAQGEAEIIEAEKLIMKEDCKLLRVKQRFRRVIEGI